MICPECRRNSDASGKYCQWCGAELRKLKGAPKSGDPEEGVYYRKYGGFWRRLFAFFIDLIFILVIDVFAVGAFSFSSTLGKVYLVLKGNSVSAVFGSGSMTQILIPVVTAAVFLLVIIPWIYYAGLEATKNQATLGKLALRLVVTDMKGRRISFARATLRHFSKILSLLVIGIGFFMIGFTCRKQGLHDIIAGCLVHIQN